MRWVVAAARWAARQITGAVDWTLEDHSRRPVVPSVRVVDIGDVTLEVPPPPAWTPDESLSADEVAELDTFAVDFRAWSIAMWAGRNASSIARGDRGDQ